MALVALPGRVDCMYQPRGGGGALVVLAAPTVVEKVVARPDSREDFVHQSRQAMGQVNGTLHLCVGLHLRCQGWRQVVLRATWHRLVMDRSLPNATHDRWTWPPLTGRSVVRTDDRGAAWLAWSPLTVPVVPPAPLFFGGPPVEEIVAETGWGVTPVGRHNTVRCAREHDAGERR